MEGAAERVGPLGGKHEMLSKTESISWVPMQEIKGRNTLTLCSFPLQSLSAPLIAWRLDNRQDLSPENTPSKVEAYCLAQSSFLTPLTIRIH